MGLWQSEAIFYNKYAVQITPGKSAKSFSNNIKCLPTENLHFLLVRTKYYEFQQHRG